MKGAAINSSVLQIYFFCLLALFSEGYRTASLSPSLPHSLVLVVPFPSIPDTQGAFRFKKKVARQHTVLPSCLVRFCTARPAQSLRPLWCTNDSEPSAPTLQPPPSSPESTLCYSCGQPGIIILLTLVIWPALVASTEQLLFS